ncbi:hypothetical protein B0H63DRAFT_510773 [Podospora didyma]|uniref:Rhodopsin domain-containing protein n=1 Tax=Podospora didyma TaxID=330526 RepID=A0AAE0NR45_9PEZI|nr:hypothetical protein B0H63DRAFT_510773 [Podospora didyma]
MTLYSPAPPVRPFSDDKPTLLVSWWITAICAFILLLRMGGRYVRVEKLFAEDKIAALALIPLFLRAGFVHLILVYGTNNVLLDGLNLSENDISRRTTGSGLVLATRVLQPAALWIYKHATLCFFDRLVGSTGKKRYIYSLLFMRIFLAVTFAAVIVSDLGECMPFQNYWAVLPDPGGQCRQGYGNLVTTAVLNIVTDLMLVVFPVIVMMVSRLALGRKILLILLFSLGIFTIIISIYRVPKVVAEHGYQATRSMWASVEILVATIATNTLALGTFMRDTGAKKPKFKYDPAVVSKARGAGPGGGPGGGGAGANASNRLPRGKDLWEDDDLDDGDSSHNGPTALHSEITSGHTKTTSTTTGGESKPSTSIHLATTLSRNASQDSLIPRGPIRVPNEVVKTTTIQVTVSRDHDAEAGGAERAVSRSGSMGGGKSLSRVERSVMASGRGIGRGAAVPLRNLEPLPNLSRPVVHIVQHMQPQQEQQQQEK